MEGRLLDDRTAELTKLASRLGSFLSVFLGQLLQIEAQKEEQRRHREGDPETWR